MNDPVLNIFDDTDDYDVTTSKAMGGTELMRKLLFEEMEKRIEQLEVERQQLNMRLSEVNFLINGYETAMKAEKEKKEKDEQTAD